MALGPWLSEIRVTQTQALQYYDSPPDDWEGC